MVVLQSRPNDTGSTSPPGGGGRIVRSRRPLPGGRAVVGGLLVALSTVVLFAAASGLGGDDGHRYLVADRDVAPGNPLVPGDVRLVEMDLPDDVAGRAFRTADVLDGAVALAPIKAGELIQRGSVGLASGGQPDGSPPVPELSFSVEREAAIDGTLQAGDRIEVLATYGSGSDSRTVRVVGSATVLAVSEGGDLGLEEGGRLVVTVAVSDAAERLNLVNAVAEAKVRLLRVTGVDSPDDEPTRSEPVDDLAGTDVSDAQREAEG